MLTNIIGLYYRFKYMSKRCHFYKARNSKFTNLTINHMNSFFIECISKVFTSKNIEILWENRKSTENIISLDTDLPIRYKLNDLGTRNIEIMLQSKFGFYFKCIALVEDEDILFPREFDGLSPNLKLLPFKKYGLKPEINVMIGAYSMDSLMLSMKNEDVKTFFSNETEFEMLKADDGTMQTFRKQKSGGILSWDITEDLYRSELDSDAISAFKLVNGQYDVLSTLNSNKWLERLIPQRLLEIYTIENTSRQYIYEFYIDDNRLEIILPLNGKNNNPQIDMGYLRDGFILQISSLDLDRHLENLIPKEEVYSYFLDEHLIDSIMLSNLKSLIDNHIKKYGRILSAELEIYVAECILIIDVYTEKVRDKSFKDEKKKTFDMFFNLFNNQLPDDWKV